MSAEPDHARLSQVLRALSGRSTDQRPTLGDVLHALDSRAAAMILLAFSIPAVVPTPRIPIGALFGWALAFVGLQMVLGSQQLRLPGRLARLRIGQGQLERMVGRAAPHLERIERWLQMRVVGLSAPRAVRALGAVVFAMGVLIVLPIPFGNTLPALAVFALALGLAQRDGIAVVVGLALAAIATATSAALIGGSWWLVERYLGI
jgi:hypothetical protein